MSERDRELMIMAVNVNGRMRRFEMMGLPAELQDEIIEGLDTRQLTFSKAEQKLAEAGFTLSRESIRRWYEAILAGRRQDNANAAYQNAMAQLAEMGSITKGVEALTAVTIRQLIAGMEDGSIPMDGKTLVKVTTILAKTLTKLNVGGTAKPVGGQVIDQQNELPPQKVGQIKGIFGLDNPLMAQIDDPEPGSEDGPRLNADAED